MAEKIKLFELDIDLDAAIKSASAFKTEADVLKGKLQELSKAGDTGSETFTRLKGEFDSVNAQYRVSQREVSKLTELQGKEIKTVEQGRVALSVLNSQWAKTASLYGENSEEAEKLAGKTKQVRERLKELESSVGDNTRNVGNYTQSFKDAIQQSGLFGQAQAVVNNVTSAGGPIIAFVSTGLKDISKQYKKSQIETTGFTKAQIAAHLTSTTLTAGLKLLRLALIATGIGAIVVLIGSLVAWFTKTQAGIDLVNKALAGMGAFFDVLTDRVAKFGGGLMKIFSGDIQGGLKDVTTAFEGMGDEISREIALAVKLEEVLQGVAKAEVNLDIRRKASNARLKELNKTIEDQSKGEAERLAAAEEFNKIEAGLVAEEVANQEKRVAAMLGFAEVTDEVRDKIKQIGEEGVSLDQLGLSESTLEDAKAFGAEIGKLFDLQTASDEKITTNQTKLNSIRTQQRAKEEAAAKAAQAAAKQRVDDAIKESQVQLQIYIEQNKGKADSLAEGLKIEETARDKRLKILAEEVAAGKKTKSEAELEDLKIKNDFLSRQKDLTLEFAEKELEAVRLRNADRIAEGTLLTDQLVDQERQRFERIAEAEREFAAKRLEQGIINQLQYNAEISRIDEESLANKEAVQAERDAQERERQAVDFENRVAIESENFLQFLDLQKERLEMQRLAEIEKAEKTGADVSLINQKFAAQDQAIEEEKGRFKSEVASQTLGNLVSILGKESEAGKAVALVQIAIETQKAAMSAYASLAGIPIVGPALGAVAAAAAIAAGLRSAGTVAGIGKPKLPKAAKGITLEGRSHTQGGETLYNSSGTPLVEAEAGENVYVLNKRASGLINTLSNINQLTGGVSLNKRTRYAAAGGMVQKSVRSAEGINYEALSASLAEAYSALPPSFVAVKEINDGQGRFAEVKEGARF